jgi:GntR family transcriptional regulator
MAANDAQLPAMRLTEQTRARARRSPRRPLYATTAEDIRALILDNDLAPGCQLPSEEELTKLFAVSRSTVREALRELDVSGVIIRSRGRRGTLVANPQRIVTGLTTLESIEALADRQGWRCETIDVVIGVRRLSDTQTRILKVPVDTNATYLSRTKLKNGEPMCLCMTWIPRHIVSPAALRNSFVASITEWFLDEPDHHLASATASVSAVAADKDEASALRVEVGSPLIVLTEIFLDESMEPLCECRNVFVPGSIELVVDRQPQDTTTRG